MAGIRSGDWGLTGFKILELSHPACTFKFRFYYHLFFVSKLAFFKLFVLFTNV